MPKQDSLMKKEEILVSDTMYDVLNSPLLKKMYGTNDPDEIAGKIFKEYIEERIRRGDFEGKPGSEEIYRAFDARPEPKNK